MEWKVARRLLDEQPRRRHTRCTDGWFAKPPRLAKDVNTDEENELERLEGSYQRPGEMLKRCTPLELAITLESASAAASHVESTTTTTIYPTRESRGCRIAVAGVVARNFGPVPHVV